MPVALTHGLRPCLPRRSHSLRASRAPRALRALAPSLALRAVLLALALTSIVAHAAPARAEAERVVLAGVPDNLADATRTVLVPWQIEILRTGAPLTADPDRAGRDARVVAERSRAGAVVWLAPTAQGPALWVYDASSRQVHSRPLASPPPFDEPTAASVALSIKTLLRHSSVAPPAERIAPPERPPPAAPSQTLPPYTLLARASLRLALPAPDPDVAPLEPRLGLGATWWPSFVPGRLGVGVELELGPGLSVSKSGFRGDLQDVTARLAVHRHTPLGAWLGGRVALVPALGLGLHVTRLTGELLSDRATANILHVIPSVDAGIDVRVRLGRLLDLGAGLRAALMTRTYDDELDMRPLASSPAFLMTAGIMISVSP